MLQDTLASECLATLRQAFTDRAQLVTHAPFKLAEWQFLYRAPKPKPASAKGKNKRVLETAPDVSEYPAACIPGALSVYAPAGSHTVAASELTLLVGLVLNPEHVQRPLDMGPAADDKVCTMFSNHVMFNYCI